MLVMSSNNANSSPKNNISQILLFFSIFGVPLIIFSIKLLSVKMLITTPFIILFIKLFWPYKFDVLMIFFEILFGILSVIGSAAVPVGEYQGPTYTEIRDYMQQEPDPSKVISHLIEMRGRPETPTRNNNLPVAHPVTYSSHLTTSKNELPMALPVPSAPPQEIK